MEILAYYYNSPPASHQEISLDFPAFLPLPSRKFQSLFSDQGLKYLISGATALLLLLPSVTFAQPLRKGDQGVEVKILQQALRLQGFFPANEKVTDYYGDLTEKAVKEFQASYGLTVNGIAGDITQLALLEQLSEDSAEQLLSRSQPVSPPTKPQPSSPSPRSIPFSTPKVNPSLPSSTSILKRGSQGKEVKQLQAILKTQGYFPQTTATTEYYGSITESAVRQFQQRQGLTVDGIVGKNTWAKLTPTSAPPAILESPTETEVTPDWGTSETPSEKIDISLTKDTPSKLCRQVVTKGDSLIIRLYPTTEAEKIDYLSNGTKVGILNQGKDGWVPLKEGGYVSSAYLKPCSN